MLDVEGVGTIRTSATSLAVDHKRMELRLNILPSFASDRSGGGTERTFALASHWRNHMNLFCQETSETRPVSGSDAKPGSLFESKVSEGEEDQSRTLAPRLAKAERCSMDRLQHQHFSTENASLPKCGRFKGRILSRSRNTAWKEPVCFFESHRNVIIRLREQTFLQGAAQGNE